MGGFMQNIIESHAQKENEIATESLDRLGGNVAGTWKPDSKNIKKQINQSASREKHRKFASFISNPIFRNQSRGISENEVKEIIIKNDFFDKNRNENGKGFNNHFEMLQINSDKIIFDHTSGLMWQQHGSLEPMSFEQAKLWIAELNRIGYASFNNWRLPTLEEAMSLMNKERKNGQLYNEHIFGQRQSGIWTADLTENGNLVWVAFFNYGSCYINCLDLNNYIRAVRSV